MDTRAPINNAEVSIPKKILPITITSWRVIGRSPSTLGTNFDGIDSTVEECGIDTTSPHLEHFALLPANFAGTLKEWLLLQVKLI